MNSNHIVHFYYHHDYNIPDGQHPETVETWGRTHWLDWPQSGCYGEWIGDQTTAILFPLDIWIPQWCGSMDLRAAVTLTPPADRRRLQIWQNVHIIKLKLFYRKLSHKNEYLAFKKKKFWNEMYLYCIKP